MPTVIDELAVAITATAQQLNTTVQAAVEMAKTKLAQAEKPVELRADASGLLATVESAKQALFYLSSTAVKPVDLSQMLGTQLSQNVQEATAKVDELGNASERAGHKMAGMHGRATGLAGALQFVAQMATSMVVAMGVMAVLQFPGQLIGGALDAVAAYERLGMSLQEMLATEIQAASRGEEAVQSVASAGASTANAAAAAVRDTTERTEDVITDHAARVAEIQTEILETVGSGIADRQERLADAIASLVESHASRIAGLLADIGEAAARFAEQQAERFRAYQERIQELAEQHGQKLQDLAEQHQERRAELEKQLSDLSASYEEQKAERNKDTQEQLSEAEEEHGKNRASIEKRLYERTSAEKARALLAGELSEEEIRELGLTDIARALKREDEAYKAQQEKIKKRAEEAEAKAKASYDKQLALLQERLAKEDAEYAKKVAKEDAEYAKKAAKEEARYAREEEKAKASYDRQVASLNARIAAENAAYEKQRAKLEADAEKDLAKQEERNAERQAQLEKQLEKENKAFDRQMRDLSQRMDTVSSKAVASAIAIQPYQKQAVEGEMDRAEALELAAGKAKELLEWTEELAFLSPFEEETVTQILQTAMGYGMQSDMAKDLTQSLADYAAATGRTNEQTKLLGLALGQVWAKGRLTGEEMRQLTNAGMGVEFVAKAAGLSLKDFAKVMEEGAIDAKQLIPNLIALSDERYAGAAERQATSLSGLTSTLRDLKRIDLRKFFWEPFMVSQPYIAAFVKTLASKEFEATLTRLGGDLGNAIKSTIEGIGAAIAFLQPLLGPVFAFLGEHMDEIKWAVKALAMVLGGAMLLSVVWTVVSAIVILGQTVGALIVGVKLAEAAWNAILPSLETVWGFIDKNLVPVLKDATDWLGTELGKATKGLAAIWDGTLEPALRGVWQFIDKRVLPLFDTLTNLALAGLGEEVEALTLLWSKVLLPALEELWNFVSNYLFPLFKAVAEVYLAAWGLAFRAVATVYNQTLGPVLNALWRFIQDSIGPSVSNFASQTLAKISQVFGDIAKVWNETLGPALDSLYKFIVNDLGPKLGDFVKAVLEPFAKTWEKAKDAIVWIIDKLKDLKRFLDDFTLPDWLTPGSPTPFENGLRGISEALADIGKVTMPGFAQSLNMKPGLSALPGGSFLGGLGGQGAGNSYQFSMTVNTNAGSSSVISDFSLLKALAEG